MMEDNAINFTKEELQLIYAACMSYGDKLAETKKTISYEDEMILDRLSDRAKTSWKLAKKVAGCMQK